MRGSSREGLARALFAAEGLDVQIVTPPPPMPFAPEDPRLVDPGSLAQKTRRRHVDERVSDQRLHPPPARPAVDAYADPAPVTDVRRYEEARGILLHEQLLHQEGGSQPDGKAIGAVVMIVELGEHLAGYVPRRLPVRELLDRLGQRETDRS